MNNIYFRVGNGEMGAPEGPVVAGGQTQQPPIPDTREGVADSPSAVAANNMDPNNAAYLALRNHPETTIRPIAAENEESAAAVAEVTRHHADENLFKQVKRLVL
jgi:hypothetical protein